jgi:hypothetical protein
MKDRHTEFQPMNPMKMSEFEKHLISKEKMERMEAKEHYVMGIQGVDGGRCYGEAEEAHDELERY